MHKQSKYSTRFVGRMIATIFLMICLAGLSACSGTYGRLAINSDVKALFERYEVLPDHHYFHSGLAPHPRAIIGLHKDYALQSDFWNPVKLTPEKLQRWLSFQSPHKNYYLGNNGLDIPDSEGRKIGIWFGLKDDRDWAVVKMIDHKTVNITLPMPHGKMLRRYPGYFGNRD
jgi:hypothetical protein